MTQEVDSAGRLRVMATADLEQVLAWRNHPEIRRYMYTTHEIGLDEHRAWFERASQDARKHLLIFESGGEARGFVNLSELSALGIADWGFYVAPDALKGTGLKLGVAALQYAFEKIGLHKVCGQALDFNERSIRFHGRLGFKQEGVLRDQHFNGEGYCSIVAFGILSHEWKTLQKAG